MTERTTDEQIAQLKQRTSIAGWPGPEEWMTLVDALVAERDRADAERDKVGHWADIAQQRLERVLSLKKVVGILWRSRRMWQDRALEFEKLHDDAFMKLVAVLNRRAEIVNDAQAWAAWFAAERNWHAAGHRNYRNLLSDQRDECAEHRATEAAVRELFEGGPDTAIRTTWHEGVAYWEIPAELMRRAIEGPVT